MNDTTPAVTERMLEACSRCSAILASPEFAAIPAIAAERNVGASQLEEMVALTAQTGMPIEQWEPLAEACARRGISESSYTLQRFLLLAAGIARLPLVPQLPVTAAVKSNLLDQFLYVCAPDYDMDQLLNSRHYGFRVMSKFMRLERFPAGQVDWEISGFPRSWLAKVPLKDLPRVLNWVFLRCGGHRPFFEGHVAFRRPLPILLEAAERPAFRLMAASMKLQPGIRGFLAGSWFMDRRLGEVSPHLAWLSKWYRECVEFGAVWSDVGEAHPDAGFLIGDRRRRKLYESGQWKPRQGVLIWERKEFLRWLDRGGS